MRELLFSIFPKEFDVQTFKSGGSGGQHQNKTDSGVRIIHRESGAVGESRNYRSQYQNKKAAFERLIASGKFKIWMSRRIMEITEGKTIEKKVEEMCKEENLKVEVKDENNRWAEGKISS